MTSPSLRYNVPGSEAEQAQRAAGRPLAVIVWKTPITPAMSRIPLSTKAAFMNDAVEPNPRPLIGWLTGE